ncbi:MAG: glutamine synthetase, partial [Candidatus Chloroheliales bacterium]
AFVNLQFTDIIGILKSVTIPLEQFEDAIRDGKWFDGSSVEGFARIAESDMYLKPDLSTFAIVPWTSGRQLTARAICNVFTPDGNEFEGDPRYVLRKAMQEADRLGYTFNTGPELEFFLFKRNPDGTATTEVHDAGAYFDLSTDLGEEVRNDMTLALNAFGVEVETAHHEVAPGQHEIDFKYSDALRTADNALTLKYAFKMVAQQHGLYATFMPKPLFGVNGSGMHTHQSLFTRDGETNTFADGDDAYGLSETARHYIAGILKHARAMSAILSPTVNSYKRLVPGYEAPVYIAWARINRSALVRIPQVTPGRPKAIRLELRCPDPTCNPYLAFAVMLHAGLDGIKNELALPDPVEENLYHMGEEGRRERRIDSLPGSLSEALDVMESDPLIRTALGNHVYDHLLDARRQEYDEYRIQITDWERQRYLPIF